MTTDGIGKRIAAERKVAGLTQEAFAKRIGYSKGMVRAVEQGREPASSGFIAKAARVLAVEPEHLMGTPYYDTIEEEGPLEGLADLRAILAEGAFVRQLDPMPLSDLRARLSVVEDSLRNDKTRKALANLPALIRQLYGACHAANTEGERDQAYRLLCAAWIAAEGACARLGHSALTALILDRLDSAAIYIDDPLMTVRSLMKRARLLMAHGSTEVAMSLVEQGIGLVDGDSEAERVLRGYGLLRGAIVAGRDRNLDLAQQFVAEARDLARPMQHESDLYTTEFGPGNVEIHACAVELEAGDPGKAAREGAALKLPPDVSATRAGHHWQDNARAWILTGQPDKAMHALNMARRVAPQQTKLHPSVRESLFAIASAERRKSDSTGSFARWLGVSL
ncbi:helix-turn-helix domain-containing protein [Nocardia otitidiscaviarum]|uniref:helix-turn-helix domain-containing protein n=1 Tax=Nocardia otitidiscaviarum TaxID=1823 RepID=UPI0004A6EC07|nr:helix-turn-helix transcriptional regulator [Nocardia otitidiscaviarum]